MSTHTAVASRTNGFSRIAKNVVITKEYRPMTDRRTREAPPVHTGDDTNWRIYVDEQMHEVKVNLAVNTAITEGLSAKVDANTGITEELGKKLDEHRERTKPVIDAIEGMQNGVRYIGKFGNGIAWVVRTFWRTLRVTAPVAAALAGVWVAFHEQLDPQLHRLIMWWKG